MSVPSPHPISPPPGLVGSEPQSSAVRRHHTITAASRSARAAARATISEESQEQQTWDDEGVVDPEQVRSVGAVGEKGGSLHRQASLPARYNRGVSLDFHNCLTPSQRRSFTCCITDNLFPSLWSCIARIR
jgi:YTH domain-containing family protein